MGKGKLFIDNCIKQICKNRFSVFILLSLNVVIFRFAMLFVPDPSPNEATYLIIGRAIFEGKTFLLDVWDFKPVGIFIIFGIVQHFISDSLIAVRILGILVISAISFMIYIIKLKLGNPKSRALFSAMIFPVLLAFIKPVYESQSELFYTLFTLLALYQLFQKTSEIRVFFAGFLMGLGFMVKYVVAFDALVIFSFYIVGLFNIPKEIRFVKNINLVLPRITGSKHFCFNKPVKNQYNSFFRFYKKNFFLSLLAFLGFILPFVSYNLYYIIIDAFPEFIKATYETSKIYGERINFKREILYITDFHISTLPAILLFYFAIISYLKQPFEKKKWAVFFLLWFFVGWASVIMQGKHFSHYFIQLFVPVCLFSLDGWPFIKKKAVKLVFISMFLLLGSLSIYYNLSKITRINTEIATVTSVLKKEMKQNDILFSNVEPIYYKLKKLPPTKFVHQSVISNVSHVKAADINANDEFNHIFANKPDFVVIKGAMDNNILIDNLEKRYKILFETEGGIKIYKVKSDR